MSDAEEETGQLSIGDSDSSPSVPADSDMDKPNIIVDNQKQVHYNNNNDTDENTQGSIVLDNKNVVATDTTKDPVIQPKAEKEVSTKSQSKCCLLI